jgi:hypothetical protein
MNTTLDTAKIQTLDDAFDAYDNIHAKANNIDDVKKKNVVLEQVCLLVAIVRENLGNRQGDLFLWEITAFKNSLPQTLE